MTENGESATGQALLELAGGTPTPLAAIPGERAWRRHKRVAERVLGLLEPLEPDARRRVLAAAAILLGHDALACELVHARPGPP